MLWYNEAMQPEQPQNNTLPPVNTNPAPVSPPPEVPPPTPRPKGPPKWIWVVVGGSVLLAIILAVVFGLILMAGSKTSEQRTRQEPANARTVTINGTPYVYACSVATEADYA